MKYLALIVVLGFLAACSSKQSQSSASEATKLAENKAMTEQVQSMIRDLERLEQADFLPEVAKELPY